MVKSFRNLQDMQDEKNTKYSLVDNVDMECAFHLRLQVNLLKWRPFQMRAFHSNEPSNGLFCTRGRPLSVAPLFWWKERGKQEALI